MAGQEDLKQSRDVYVAFAFAGGDLLVEVADNGRIVFAVGAAMTLLAQPARKLGDSDFVSLFQPQDHPRLERAFARMRSGERIRHLLIYALRGDGKRVPVALSGYQHPERDNRFLLNLSHGGALVPNDVRRAPRSGLLEPESFERLAENLLDEGGGEGAGAYRLTMLELPQLSNFGEQAGHDRMDEFMAELGATLRAHSVGGDSATQLADNRYGVIHSAEVAPTTIEQAVAQLARAIAPGSDLEPNSTTMLLDSGALSGDEAVNALAYTLNRFAKEGAPATAKELSEGVSASLSATVDRMRSVKTLIERGDFELAFQPVVDLWTSNVHHFECLVRFAGSDESPYQTVTFAEDTGMAGELDAAICRRAIDFISSPAGSVEGLRFAVNLSGRSISHPPTARKILDVISRGWHLRRRLLFEVTESAEITDLDFANDVIQEIRSHGHPVCLDDFGAGSAAFHYLRALKVDHVKIDGSYVRDCTKTGESMPFLRAITSLCTELKIGTIAEFVEDEETASLLRVLKVRFGQGWHFGKPIKVRPETDPRRAWTTPSMGWRKGLLVCSSRLGTADVS
ncbi:MAG TPA: EAL domain-containing protein [Candidatus Omnitrophota bacterium]|nr:EAL domain-containing protein [Candidatus Omnitrophota bacterium]